MFADGRERRHGQLWVSLWLAIVLLRWYHQAVTIVTCFGPIIPFPQYPPQQRRTTKLKGLSSTNLRDASESSISETIIPTTFPILNVTIPRQQSDAGTGLKLKSPTKMPPITSASSISSSSSSQNMKQQFISTPELQRLQESIDIVSLIDLYNLPHFRRTSGGERASCLCPFHDDTNPSLKIDGRRGIFKCFSCGVGGTAFKFVKEYSKLHSKKELSFVEIVRLFQDLASPSPLTESDRVAFPFDVEGKMGARPNVSSVFQNVPRNVAKTSSNHNITEGTADQDAQSPQERQKHDEHRRQRILLANLHAASFYEECLFSLPQAGSARAHLRSRGINPHTVKAFAMGFAPDTYFPSQQRASSGGEATWGEGSLVNHLKDRGFNPREILDAGLAIRTQRGKNLNGDSYDKRNDSDDEQWNDQDYSTLMDRFRGRLVVPIFDAAGNYILGFGGRILEGSISTGSDYKAAKYLNSPNSLVFQKKNILFGQHMAEKTKRFGSIAAPKKTDGDAARSSLLVVEGYMDALSLWQAGIRETVASMGTALSYEQLSTASMAARKLGARIVLCLDSDDAGVAAIERLCIGQKPILVSAMENLNVEISVASLPEGIKDPADFLEKHRDSGDLENKFRLDVVNNAVEWSEWYMNRIVESHVPDDVRDGEQSFSGVFERVASFLATFENIDDVTKRACWVAPKLVNLIKSNHNNETLTDSSTARIQLESDLVEKAVYIARSKSIQFQRRFEISGDNDRTMGSPKWTIPQNLEISEDISLLEGPWKATKVSDSYLEASQVPELRGIEEQAQTAARYPRSVRKGRSRLAKANRINPTRKAMTTYIGGLRSNSLDENWLGARKELSGKEFNHLRYELSIQSSKRDKMTKHIGPATCIRFNTNDYHGTWTTMDAVLAGYTTTVFPKNSDFLRKGTSSLIRIREGDMSTFVEDILLRTLVHYPGARKALSESIRASDASGSGGIVTWSSPEKAWLFKCLVENNEDSRKLDDVMQLRSVLFGRPDLLPGALSRGSVPFADLSKPVEAENDQIKDPTFASSSLDMEGVKHGPISEIGNDWPDDEEAKMDPISPLRRTSISPTPAIVSDEWSDFQEIGEFTSSLFADEDDAELPIANVPCENDPLDAISLPLKDEIHGSDAIPITSSSNPSLTRPNFNTVIEPERIIGTSSTAGFLEADFVVSRLPGLEELAPKDVGILDRFFATAPDEELDIFRKPDEDHDWLETGSNDNKAEWAVQDLYTMLQFTSVMQRIGTGRAHILAESGMIPTPGGDDRQQMFHAAALDRGDENLISSTSDTNTSRSDLDEYCTGVGLRQDLHRIRSLFQANQRAIGRIYSLIHAQFSDSNMLTRGYSWLGKVLQFNQRKMEAWTAIVEQTDGFFYSDEGIEEFEIAVADEWNELSNEGEMWDWNKNVDVSHESYIAANFPEGEEGMSDEVFEQIESDWGWAMDDEDDDDGDSESAEEWTDDNVEDDDDDDDQWVLSEEGDVRFDDEEEWVMSGEDKGEQMGIETV